VKIQGFIKTPSITSVARLKYQLTTSAPATANGIHSLSGGGWWASSCWRTPGSHL